MPCCVHALYLDNTLPAVFQAGDWVLVSAQPHLLQLLPPLKPDWKLQDSAKPISKELYYSLDHMINVMNEVIQKLPQLASL